MQLCEADFIDICVKHFQPVDRPRVLENKVLIEPVAEHVRDTQQKQNIIRRQYAGNGDVHGFLEAARAVHVGRVVQLLVDTRYRGEIDYGRPTRAFPYADAYLEDPRPIHVDEYIRRLLNQAEAAKHVVDGAVIRVEEREKQRIHQHPGYKIRQRSKRLDNPGYAFGYALREPCRHDGEHDRDRRRDDAHKAQYQGISHYRREIADP